MIRIFISYSSADQDVADRLVSDLRRLKEVEVWYDRFEVLIGHDISDKIYEGLLVSTYIAIILTRNSVESRWVREEMNWAKRRSIESNGDRVILPLLFDDCEIPGVIEGLKYADFRDSYSKGFGDLAGALGVHLVNVQGNPIPDIWGQFRRVISDAPGRHFTIEEARGFVRERSSDRRLGFRYALEACLSRFQFEGDVFHYDGAPLAPRDSEDYYMREVVFSHAVLRVWRLTDRALDRLENDKSPRGYRRRNALACFVDELEWEIYCHRNGVWDVRLVCRVLGEAAGVIKGVEIPRFSLRGFLGLNKTDMK